VHPLDSMAFYGVRISAAVKSATVPPSYAPPTPPLLERSSTQQLDAEPAKAALPPAPPRPAHRRDSRAPGPPPGPRVGILTGTALWNRRKPDNDRCSELEPCCPLLPMRYWA